MFKYFIPFCVLFCLLACESKFPNAEDIVGRAYKTADYNKLQQGWWYVLKNEHCEVGVTLALDSDYSYLQENCGGISKGSYIFKGDSIFLLETEFRNNDSTLHLSTDTLPDYGYQIQNNGGLLSVSQIISNGKVSNSRSRLGVVRSQ